MSRPSASCSGNTARPASQSPAFQYLVALIIEDEIEHHRVFQDLASALKTDAGLQPEQPTVPRLDQLGPAGHRPHGACSNANRPIREELRCLAKDLRDVKDTTLWELLVKLMEMGTA